MFNRNTLGVYELGSIFKIFTVAMALDAGTSTLASTYDASHDIHIGRFTIGDYHGKHRVAERPGNPDVFVEHRRGQDGDGRRRPDGSRNSSPVSAC